MHEDPLAIAPARQTRICGFCGRDAWFELRTAVWAGVWWVSSGDERPLISGLYQCAGCQRASLFVFQTFGGYGGPHVSMLDAFPTARGHPKDLLPEDIQQDWLEAVTCVLDGQFRASVLMARSALQRAVRSLHAFRGSLNSELDNLVTAGLITTQLRANADELRITGNDVAHPEEMGSITEADAQDSIVFLSDFLDATIIVPERQRRRAADRAAPGGTGQ